MDRVVVVLAVVGLAAVVAALVQRRKPDPPAQPVEHVAPAQVDRADFVGSERPWLVAAFTSATCDTCAAVWAKAQVLESADVAAVELEYGRDRALHDRYRITAVPTVILADEHGVVRESFIGSVSATHLWAALAELREPGSVPRDEGCSGHS